MRLLSSDVSVGITAHKRSLFSFQLRNISCYLNVTRKLKYVISLDN